ncbi:hypothetical protein RB195_005830 [Necator americanus]|uniref:Amiloride-sensitive sodium channel n=1 Tax=Necator americanus TaxID=51031 RepID=A0ABR1BTL9_NECAM
MALKLPTLVIEPEGTLKKVPSNTDSRVSFFLPDELPPEPTSSASLAPPQHYGSSRGSIFESTSRLKKRASHIILEVPVAQLKKINETEGVGSIKRESKHFCDNTTLHGPKRVYYGKKFSFVFWIVMLMVSLVLLTLQVVTLISMYVSHPTVSQVSFLIKDDGIEFPLVTLCNFNPIKKSYIRHINKTHDFSDDLLDYLMEFLIDANTLYGTADRANLHVGEKALESYLMTHPNFTVQEFFMDAGFECEESMMLCSFGGRQFSCCQYMTAMLTNLGKCYTLDLQSSGKDWMEKQMEAGVTAGLQIITDVHLEEQFDGTGDDADPIFSDDFENGYRYYVHAPATVPYLVSEGISVSPSTRVYSAISTNSYILLSAERWGNCTSKWPHDFDSQLPYSAVNCDSICKAKFFNAKCGCSPFTYDIEKSFSLCTPFQTVRCIDDYIRKTVNASDEGGKAETLVVNEGQKSPILARNQVNHYKSHEFNMPRTVEHEQYSEMYQRTIQFVRHCQQHQVAPNIIAKKLLHEISGVSKENRQIHSRATTPAYGNEGKTGSYVLAVEEVLGPSFAHVQSTGPEISRKIVGGLQLVHDRLWVRAKEEERREENGIAERVSLPRTVYKPLNPYPTVDNKFLVFATSTYSVLERFSKRLINLNLAVAQRRGLLEIRNLCVAEKIQVSVSDKGGEFVLLSRELDVAITRQHLGDEDDRRMS